MIPGNTNAPAEAGANETDQLGGRSTTTVTQAKSPWKRLPRVRPYLVATRGRIEYVVRCPACKRMHRHITLGIHRGPCGTEYNVRARRGRHA
ncbi:hypothetical protein PV355_09940 [Streptomyces stelliscabiei]|uniref:hypothetical protein n=1 Tax=Streptomyces stelliscabiei TaxID=146820 RepID=UPI0029A7C5E2|nr:hypothetical protein [Streptomyces stelliscabiei]MDX2515460.1 hypothetical protein [Streptomyces stelliscabiei]